MQGRTEAAQSRRNEAYQAADGLRAREAEIAQLMNAMVRVAQDNLNQAMVAIRQSKTETYTNLIYMTVLILFVVSLFSWIALQRSTVLPLQRIGEKLRLIGRGRSLTTVRPGTAKRRRG